MSCSSELIKPTVGLIGPSDLARCTEAQVTAWAWDWGLKLEGGDSFLGLLNPSPVESDAISSKCQKSVELQDTQVVSDNCLGMWKTPPHLGTGYKITVARFVNYYC